MSLILLLLKSTPLFSIKAFTCIHFMIHLHLNSLLNPATIDCISQALTHWSNRRWVVHPTFGVMCQLPEDLLLKCSCLPPQPPTRTRSARVRCFSFFAFTSSPYDCKKLWNSDLRVKVSHLFPSPVKAKKGTILHLQNALYQRIAGEGEG